MIEGEANTRIHRRNIKNDHNTSLKKFLHTDSAMMYLETLSKHHINHIKLYESLKTATSSRWSYSESDQIVTSISLGIISSVCSHVWS